MARAYKEVIRIAATRKVDMRTAAYLLAIDKVAAATKVCGIFL